MRTHAVPGSLLQDEFLVVRNGQEIPIPIDQLTVAEVEAIGKRLNAAAESLYNRLKELHQMNLSEKLRHSNG